MSGICAMLANTWVVLRSINPQSVTEYAFAGH